MVSEASMLSLSVEDGVEDSDWPDGHEAEAEVCDEEIVWLDKHVFVIPIWLVFILYTNDAIFACQDNELLLKPAATAMFDSFELRTV